MAQFDNGYRFVQGGKSVAVLDPDGKLTLKDDGGNLEVHASWKDYIRDTLGDKPVTGGPDAAIEQLATVLGEYQPIVPPSSGTQVKETKKMVKTNGAAAAAVAVEKPAAKVAPKPKVATAKPTAKVKASTSGERTECLCGCGKKANPGRNFLQGHDSTYKSAVLKIRRGSEKFTSLTPGGQKLFKDQGYRVGDLAEA